MLSVIYISLLLQAAPNGPPVALLERAGAAIARGDLAAAEADLIALLKAEPRNIGALGNLGIVYSRTDRLPQAVTTYQKALALAPNEPGLLLNLGLVHLKQENYAAAKPLFARIARQGKPSPQVRELLATARLFTGEVDAALAELEQLNREEPANSGVLYLLAIAYLKKQDRATASKAFDNLMAVLSPEQGHYLAGKAYYETALFEDAERELKQAGATPGAALELAKTYLSLRRHEEAEAALRRASGVEATYYLGALLIQEGKPEEGEQLLRRVLEQQPENWAALYYLGKQRKEIALLERAARLNPAESAIWFQLAQAYRQAGRTADAQRAAARVSVLKRNAPEAAILKPR